MQSQATGERRQDQSRSVGWLDRATFAAVLVVGTIAPGATMQGGSCGATMRGMLPSSKVRTA